MSVELSESQQQASDAENGALIVVDPRTNVRCRLVPDDPFSDSHETPDDDIRAGRIHEFDHVDDMFEHLKRVD